MAQRKVWTFSRSHSLAVPKPWPESRFLLTSWCLVISDVLHRIVARTRGGREKRKWYEKWHMPCRGEGFLSEERRFMRPRVPASHTMQVSTAKSFNLFGSHYLPCLPHRALEKRGWGERGGLQKSCGDLKKYIHVFFDTPVFKRWSLIPLLWVWAWFHNSLLTNRIKKWWCRVCVYVCVYGREGVRGCFLYNHFLGY